MARINLLMGIHNHQPVGNFDGVFKEAYEKCYLPFISALERHPKIRLSLHYTGPLLEWIEWNYPDFFKRISALVEKKQIELLTGGFYEPILPIIPEADAIGQIRMQTRFTIERFGYNPTGLWLAERVWDPSLPKILSASDVRYTILDESHFTYAGLSHKDIYGYYLTERENSTIAIFPIDKTLRYYIPFKVPEETINYLKKLAEERGEIGVTYADDGEKFGVWPGTYKWVFEEGWLEKFFAALEENSEWINLMTYSEFLDIYPPTGRVYLPTASYEEMMEWALPAEAIEQYERMVDGLKTSERLEEYRPFIRGGFWDNFLAKYPEANNMHKKMLYVSKKVNSSFKTGDPKGEAAKKELYRSQCNCAYWHGLFGGLYLNYLRHAVYKHIILAEAAADDKGNKGREGWLSAEVIDYNSDGRKEIIISNPLINATIAPDYGGGIIEIDFKPKAFNLSNVIARRREGYHHKLKKAVNNPETTAEPISIHHIIKSKEEGIEKFLFYDWHNRYSFLDHLIEPATAFESFARVDYKELGDFVNQPYKIEEFSFFKNKKEGYVILKRDGAVYNGGTARPLTIRKRFYFNGNSGMIECVYSLINSGSERIEALFGIELNLTLLAGRDNDRYYTLQDREDEKRMMETHGDFSDIDTICLQDKWSGIKVDISCSEKSRLWVYPVETVSQSEEGFERTYQGTAFLPLWKLNLQPREEWGVNIRVDIK